MSTQTAGRIVGALFLSAFFFYGGGSFLVDSATHGATAYPSNAASLRMLSAGSALMLANSIAVATIGVVVFKVLRRSHPRTARSYVATRSAEAVLLASAPLAMLTLVLLDSANSYVGVQRLATSAVENSDTTYWLAMAILGVGSIYFCWALMTSSLLPRFLAIGGMAGYAIIALGSVLELAEYEVGLLLSAPGGVFEVVAGGYLLVRGFVPRSAQVATGGGCSPRAASAGAPT